MLNPRLDLMTDYPFRRLADLLGPAKGDSSIMSIGEPQHEAPPMVAEILAREASGWGRYPPMNGTPAFRAAVASWLERRFDLGPGLINPETQVLPIAGTKEGLSQVAALVSGERAGGKKPVALLPNPFYQIYSGAAILAGAEPVFVPATRETGFLPDFAGLPRDILDRASIAYFCTPANPQGAVASLDQLKTMVELARKHDFVLASDECYSEIYYDQAPAGALAAAQALGGGFDNVLVFHSLSKRSSVPGLRSGFVAGDAKLIDAYNRMRAYVGVALAFPILAASTALWSDETHVEANRALYRQKFAIAEEILGDRFGFYRPAGGFYLWLDVGNGEDAAKKLFTRANIRVMPGAYMSRAEQDGSNLGAPYIRVALVHDIATTRRALTQMTKALGEA